MPDDSRSFSVRAGDRIRAAHIASLSAGREQVGANSDPSYGTPFGRSWQRAQAPRARVLRPPFWLYQSDDPDAPPESPRNTIRITPGTVSRRLPSNYDGLFTITGPGGDTPVWVWVTFGADYASGVLEVTSLEIDTGAEIPDDETPGEGQPPTTVHVDLGVVFLDEDGNITSVASTLQRSIFPQVVVTNVDCAVVSRAVLI